MCEQILEYHLKRYSYNSELNIKQFATRMYNYEMSGRDIEKVVNKARQKSTLAGAPMILINAMEDAIKEMVDQKKKILEEERKKKDVQKREEEIRVLELQALKEEAQERFNKRLKEHDDERRQYEETDIDPTEQFVNVSQAAKNLRDIFRS